MGSEQGAQMENIFECLVGALSKMLGSEGVSCFANDLSEAWVRTYGSCRMCCIADQDGPALMPGTEFLPVIETKLRRSSAMIGSRHTISDVP